MIDLTAARLAASSRTGRYVLAGAILAAATGVAVVFDTLGLTTANAVLVYLLGVTAAAAWLGRGPAVAASFAAVLLFNFFFTEPRYTLRVHDNGYLFTFGVMLTIALLVSALTARSKQVDRSIAQAETERLRSALLSSVSHDLRTPLAAITGASSSLLDDDERIPPAERRELLLSIHEAGDRLTRLVDNLLHMTRLESGHLEPEREWNFVEDLVGSALNRLAHQLDEHAVGVRLPETMPMVRVDGVLIELVITNLLDNAAKYSPPGSPIEISADAGEGRVAIEVADRGPGLTAEEKERAFEKFYRGRRWRDDGTRGSGLGLSICAAIARLHEGALTVDDRPGGGARFRLTLPLEQQPPSIDLEARDGNAAAVA